MRKIYTRLRVLGFCAASLTVVLPASAATYKSIPLDSGGWFSGLAVHSSGRIYGYGDLFNAYRSDDAGQTWINLNRDLHAVPGEHGSIATDAAVSGLAVAPTDKDFVVMRSSWRLLKSINGGANWTVLLADIDGHNNNSFGNAPNNGQLRRGSSPVMVHPNDKNEIWLVSRRKNKGTASLWRSTNGGTDWSQLGGTTFENAQATTVYVHPNFPNQIWVGTEKGLYVSTGSDRSNLTWTYVWGSGLTITSTNNRTGLPPYVKAVVRNSNGVGYMASDLGGYTIVASDWTNPSTYKFTRILSDPGQWGPDNATVLSDGKFVSGKDQAKNLISVNSDGTATLTALGMNLDSNSPRPIWSPPFAANSKIEGGHDFLVQDPTLTSRWFITGGMAPKISTDSGNTWKYVPNGGGIGGVVTLKVNFPRNKPSVAMVPGSDVGVTIVTDGGASGNAAYSSNRDFTTHQTYHEVMSNDGVTMIAAGVNQSNNNTSIIKSTNGGANWAAVAFTGLPNNKEGITRSVMNPNDSNDLLVLMGEGGSPSNPGLYRTTNGKDFTQVTSGLPTFGGDYSTGSRYHADQSWLEADSGSRSTYRYLALRKNLYRSDNNGQTWTEVTHPFVGSNGGRDWITDFDVDHAKPGRLWACSNYSGLKYSDNGGTSWSTALSGLGQVRSVDAHAGRIAILSTDTAWAKYGIYYSHNDGANWVEATSAGNRLATTRDVAIDPTMTRKIWVSGVSVNVISDIDGTSTSTVTTPTNLVSNPSFDAEAYDTQTPSGWSEAQYDANWASVTANASYTEAYGGSASGARHGTHWSTSAYRVYTYQTKTGLTNGLYTLRAKALRGGAASYCYLEAKGFGGSARTANLPVSSTYQTVEIKDINVTNGQATIGFWSEASANAWAYFDDVEFFKQ